MSPFTRETSPARSMSAFVMPLTSAKYVGEPRMMPSAASMAATHSFRKSSVTAQRRFLAAAQP